MDEPPVRESEERVGGPWWNFTGWLLGILGGISAFLGFFIMFGPEDEYIGIGGDWSWQVGEISAAWMYGLLIGGLAALAIGIAIAILGGQETERVGGREAGLTDLYWHTGIFVLVNAFIWIQDIAIGGGVDYAYWVTIPWAIGLAVHAAVYYSQRRHTPQHLQPH